MKNIRVKNMVLKPGRPKIAALIMGKNHDEILRQVDKAVESPCDMLEWRADYLLGNIDNFEEEFESTRLHGEIIRILDEIDYRTESMPVIFTIRSKSHGGTLELKQSQVYDLSALVAQSKLVDFVDMEIPKGDVEYDEKALMKQTDIIHGFGVKVIQSYHEFDCVVKNEEIERITSAMRRMGADVVKVATMVNTQEEAVDLLRVTNRITQKNNGPSIIIGMGKAGLITRVAGGKYGSCISFAFLEEGSAPGQLDVATLAKLLDEHYRQ